MFFTDRGQLQERLKGQTLVFEMSIREMSSSWNGSEEENNFQDSKKKLLEEEEKVEVKNEGGRK